MRLVGTAASPAWARTVAFLGPNVSAFVSAHPLEEWVGWFQRPGSSTSGRGRSCSAPRRALGREAR